MLGEEEDYGDEDQEEQVKMVNDQFQQIYEGDPKLQALLGEEANKLTVEEKYHILQKYLQGGGVEGLMAEDEDDDLTEEEK